MNKNMMKFEQENMIKFEQESQKQALPMIP